MHHHIETNFISKNILVYLQNIIECSKLDSPRDWIASVDQAIDSVNLPSGNFVACYAAAGRQLGRLSPDYSDKQTAQLHDVGVVVPECWSVADCGRALLLVSALNALESNKHVDFIGRIYRTGDNTEQQAVLRTLILLPDSARFVNIAINACRSNVRSVFESIACKNMYPTRFFPELNFNQLILKALFIGTPVRDIVGLEERRTPELAEMVSDYASELQAANRQVSMDIQYLLKSVNFIL